MNINLSTIALSLTLLIAPACAQDEGSAPHAPAPTESLTPTPQFTTSPSPTAPAKPRFEGHASVIDDATRARMTSSWHRPNFDDQ